MPTTWRSQPSSATSLSTNTDVPITWMYRWPPLWPAGSMLSAAYSSAELGWRESWRIAGMRSTGHGSMSYPCRHGTLVASPGLAAQPTCAGTYAAHHVASRHHRAGTPARNMGGRRNGRVSDDRGLRLPRDDLVRTRRQTLPRLHAADPAPRHRGAHAQRDRLLAGAGAGTAGDRDGPAHRSHGDLRRWHRGA